MPLLWLPLSAEHEDGGGSESEGGGGGVGGVGRGGGGGGGGGGAGYACPLYGLPGRTDLVDTLLISPGAGRSARHWVLRSVALVAAGED